MTMLDQLRSRSKDRNDIVSRSWSMIELLFVLREIIIANKGFHVGLYTASCNLILQLPIISRCCGLKNPPSSLIDIHIWTLGLIICNYIMLTHSAIDLDRSTAGQWGIPINMQVLAFNFNLSSLQYMIPALVKRLYSNHTISHVYIMYWLARTRLTLMLFNLNAHIYDSGSYYVLVLVCTKLRFRLLCTCLVISYDTYDSIILSHGWLCRTELLGAWEVETWYHSSNFLDLKRPMASPFKIPRRIYLALWHWQSAYLLLSALKAIVLVLGSSRRSSRVLRFSEL